MRVCGVELHNNEAIVCLLSIDKDLFDLPDCRVRRVPLQSVNSREHLQTFQFAFAKLMEDYKVEKVSIRERMMKGKYAGGAVGFKLEAAIQLIEGLEVELLSPTIIKETLARNPLPIHFNDTGLKVFQETAFVCAYASLLKDKFQAI
ncbi:MAG: hypothetical protein ACI9Y1_003139 [Lentisphaeria bacterium]|jgi:hypothetical protein